MEKKYFYKPKKAKDLGYYTKIIRSLSIYDLEGDIDDIIETLVELKKTYKKGTVSLRERTEYSYYDGQETFLDVVHTYPETEALRTKRLALSKKRIAAAKEITESAFKEELLKRGKAAVYELFETGMLE